MQSRTPSTTPAQAQSSAPTTAAQSTESESEVDLQDTMGNAALAESMLGDPQDEVEEVFTFDVPMDQGESNSTSYEGEKSLTGANARWEGTWDVSSSTKQVGEKWFARLDKADRIFKYWINSGATWNHIKDFPGGAYDASFNMKEGSKKHEIAEINGTAALSDILVATVRNGIKAGFDTAAAAKKNLKDVWSAAMKVYKPAQKKISDHSNPLGPDAEWAYYKVKYAEYKSSQATPDAEE